MVTYVANYQGFDKIDAAESMEVGNVFRRLDMLH